jgi:uncharacterized RDD family membrane protein YckC
MTVTARPWDAIDAQLADQPGRARLVTPEGVVLTFPTAGLVTRTLGQLVDVLVVGFGASVASIPIGLVFAESWVGAVMAIVIAFLAIFGYPVAMEVFGRGRSLGKRAVGTRVVTVDGTPVRFRHAAVRAAFLLVDMLIVPVAAIGLVTIWTSRSNQRLGDLVAGTVVIVERGAAKGTPPLVLPNIEPLVRWLATNDLRGVTQQHDALARAFLARAHEMSPDGRYHVATKLAGVLAARIGVVAPPDWPSELFIAGVVAARQHGQRSTRNPLPPPGVRR